MKNIAKKTLQEIADSIPLSVYQKVVRREVVSLFYHLVADQPIAHVRHLYPHLPTPLFEQDLIYLKENYNVISYEHLARRAAGKVKLPPKAVFLSFDDGFAECFTVVRPLLLKYELPCTFFVVTDLIDNRKMYYRNRVSLCIEARHTLDPDDLDEMLSRISSAFGVTLESRKAFVHWIKSLTDELAVERVCDMLEVDVREYLRTRQPYLTSEQIRTLAVEGFTVGAHSQRHHKLSRLSQPEIEREIAESCRIVGELTTRAQVPFSFPNSASGIDRRLLARIKNEHAHIGLLFDTKGLSRDEDYLVNRVWVESPLLNPTGEIPLPQILQRAYQRYTVDRLGLQKRRMSG